MTRSLDQQSYRADQLCKLPRRYVSGRPSEGKYLISYRQEYPRNNTYCRVAPHRPACADLRFHFPGCSFHPCRRGDASRQEGVHNSYNSLTASTSLPGPICRSIRRRLLITRAWIQLRKNHPAFRLSTGDKVRQHLEFLPCQQTCLVGFQLKNLEGIDAWKNIIVIYNFNKEAKMMQIPEGNYTVACCNGVINEEGLGFVSERMLRLPLSQP